MDRTTAQTVLVIGAVAFFLAFAVRSSSGRLLLMRYVPFDWIITLQRVLAVVGAALILIGFFGRAY